MTYRTQTFSFWWLMVHRKEVNKKKIILPLSWYSFLKGVGYRKEGKTEGVFPLGQSQGQPQKKMLIGDQNWEKLFQACDETLGDMWCMGSRLNTEADWTSGGGLGAGVLCGSFTGALWALKCMPAARSEACSGLFTLAEAEISQRQLRAWTAGGGSRFSRAFSKHKKENEKREKEKNVWEKADTGSWSLHSGVAT